MKPLENDSKESDVEEAADETYAKAPEVARATFLASPKSEEYLRKLLGLGMVWRYAVPGVETVAHASIGKQVEA